MPTDLTARFVQAARGAASWSEDRFLAVMERIVAIADEAGIDPDPAGIDWSRSRQERWGRVHDGRYAIALLRSDVPLAIIVDPYAGLLQSFLEEGGLEVIAVENFESQDYQLDLLQTIQAIPDFHWTADFIDPHQISIIDLWWVTK